MYLAHQGTDPTRGSKPPELDSRPLGRIPCPQSCIGFHTMQTGMLLPCTAFPGMLWQQWFSKYLLRRDLQVAYLVSKPSRIAQRSPKPGAANGQPSGWLALGMAVRAAPGGTSLCVCRRLEATDGRRQSSISPKVLVHHPPVDGADRQGAPW